MRLPALFLAFTISSLAATEVVVSWDGPGTLWSSSNLSDWTALPDLRSPAVLPMREQEFFRLTSTAQGITLIWDASPTESVTGYNLYCGPASGDYTQRIDVGTNLTWQLPTAPGVIEYFTATAYDQNGSESDFSNEVTYSAPECAPAKILIQ